MSSLNFIPNPINPTPVACINCLRPVDPTLTHTPDVSDIYRTVDGGYTEVRWASHAEWERRFDGRRNPYNAWPVGLTQGSCWCNECRPRQ